MPRKRNNAFTLYSTVDLCTRQQCKTLRGCHGNATMRSLCILLLTCVAVNNVNPFGVAMKTQQCLHSVFLLLTRVAANSAKLFGVFMETQQCVNPFGVATETQRCVHSVFLLLI